jgi:hypothetical protein
MPDFPVRDATSLVDFVTQLAGKPSRLINIYGIPLRGVGGRRAAYVGVDAKGCRSQSYVDALVARSQGGGLEGTYQHDWSRVPGKLKHLWRQGFFYSGAPIVCLRQVPSSAESAAAFALEHILGKGNAVGGILALDSHADAVHDACVLQRLHDGAKCVRCGAGDHFASASHCLEEKVAIDKLPTRVQQLKRKLDVAEATVRNVRAANHQREPIRPTPKQPLATLTSSSPRVPKPPDRPPSQHVVVPPRKGTPAYRPRSWGSLQKCLTFFDVNGVQACLLRDLVAAMQLDPRHSEQDVMRWRAAKVPHTDGAHVWAPISCKGVRGKPPWLLTHVAAESIYQHLV